MSLGEALVKSGLISREHLRLALARQVVFGGRIGTNIVALGILREEELTEFLSKFLKVPAATARELGHIEPEVIESLSKELAERYKAVPFRKEKNRLHVAMLEPKNIQALDELRFLSGYDIIPYVASELRLLHALERYYGLKRDLRFVSILERQEETAQEAQKSTQQEALQKVKEAFADVKSREEVAGLVLREASKVASRAALFVVKGQEARGWMGRGLKVEGFALKADLPGIFTEVIARKAYYRGPLLDVHGNTEFIELLGGTPQDCILTPVNIRDRVVALLYADNGLGRVLDAQVSYLHTLCALASLAFELLIVRKKILQL